MQILWVELENVKSFVLTKVTFAPGVNSIVGHNGAGKSTILEAIGFALFDAVDYVPQSLFIRAGCNYARVTVTFVSSADERAYTVERRIGTRSAYLVHDPELNERICDGKADVAIFLRQHMGLEPGVSLTSLFKDAVGVPQGTLTAAFALTPKDRKGIFDALLRVDEYNKVWERLREPMNILADRRKAAGYAIGTLRERLARLPDLQAELHTATVQLREAEERLGAVRAELTAVQARRSALDAVQSEVQAAERALAQANQQLQGSQVRQMSADQALADALAARELVTKHQAGHDRYMAAQTEQTRLDRLVRQRQQVEARRAAADREVALARAKLERLAADIDQAQAAAVTAAQLAPQVQEQSRAEEEVAQATQQHARWEEAQRRLGELEAQALRLTQRRVTLQEQVARGQEIEATLRVLDTELAAAGAVIVQQRDAMAGFKTRADLIKEQSATLADVQTAICPLCEQPLTEVHRQEILARNDDQLQAMRREFRAVQLAVEAGDQANSQRQAQVKSLQAELRKLARSQELDTVDNELRTTQVAVGEASAQAAELAAVAETLATLRKQLAGFGDARRRYDLAQAQAAQAQPLLAQQATVREQAAQGEAALATLVEELAAFADLDRQLDAVAADLAQSQADYQALLANRRQAEEVEQRRTAAQEATEALSALAARVAALEEAQRLAAAQFDATEFGEVVAQERSLRQELGGLEIGVMHLRREQERQARELAELEALTVTLAETEERLARLEWEESALAHLRELIRQAGPYIAETVSRQVSEGARQIFSDLMQDYSRHLAWTQDYAITLEVDGHERQFSQLSGGEQMSAALSVRLALLREMSNINVAFFDEPTANLDETRRETLARQILQVRGFQQLFVISHDDTFEQATQNLVRVARVDGVSQVSYG